MIVQVANEPRFADKPPARIVPALADEGIPRLSEKVKKLLSSAGYSIPVGS